MEKSIFKPIYIIPGMIIAAAGLGYFFWQKKSLSGTKVLTIDTSSLRHVQNE